MAAARPPSQGVVRTWGFTKRLTRRVRLDNGVPPDNDHVHRIDCAEQVDQGSAGDGADANGE
jgi:hypothetical protein